MALFGPGKSIAASLFGGGGQEPQGPTAQAANATGATTNSPFLQYMQANAGASQDVARQMMGPKPEPDYRMALAQMGLGILSQPGGQAPIQAIAKGAQTAMPLFMKEQNRGREYEEKINHMAAKLNMSGAEFDSKLGGERKGVKCFDGTCIDEDSYQQYLRETDGDIEAAFEMATVHRKRPTAQENAKHLAQLRRNLEILKNRPNAKREEIQLAQDELEAMEAQIFKEEDGTTVTIGMMGPDGTFKTFSGTPGSVGNAVTTLNNADQAQELKTKQEATDQVLYYASNIHNIMDRASAAAGGRLGGLASSAAAWGKAINEGLDGPRAQQFREEVGENPMRKIEELRRDPESRNLLGDGTLDSLSKIGQDNAQALSNIVGLAYATARAEEPGGRLSNADIAAAMSATGFDPEAMLNDPDRVRVGVTELAKRNLAAYERALELSGSDADAMLQNDIVLNKRLKEYGFRWTGGPRGKLEYNPSNAGYGPVESQGGQGSQGDTGGQGGQSSSQSAPSQGGGGQQAPQQEPSPSPDPAPPPAAGPAPVDVKSKAEYDNLPSGTRFRAPDGSIRVKP